MKKGNSNNLKRGVMAKAIAFHDFENKNIDIKKLTEYAISLFKEACLEIILGSASGPLIKSKKMTRFKTAIKNLEKSFYKEIEGFGFYATPAEYDDTSWEALMDCVYYQNTFTITFDPLIASWDQNKINLIVKALMQILGARYGYVFEREFKKGPLWYGFGTLYNIDFNDSEVESISIWGDVYNCLSQEKYIGRIRDIYPMNMLSSPHLNYEVLQGVTLKQWIESNSLHGRFDALCDGRVAWWVESDQISHIREALKPSGILIAV